MEKSKLFDLSLFIFRRDLRLIDNSALNFASMNSKTIIPAFFLDKRQVDRTENEYFSSNSIQFMIESLASLNSNLKNFNSKLFLFYGDLENNIEKLIKEVKIQAIYINEDYTPFAVKRDSRLKEICNNHRIQLISCEDIMLTGPNSVKLAKGDFYKKYTPYYNAASLIKVPDVKTENNLNVINVSNAKSETLEKIKKAFKNHPASLNQTNIGTLSEKNFFFDFEFNKYSDDFVTDVLSFLKIILNKHVIVKGGREAAEERLSYLKKFKSYKDTRNFPIISSTLLSAYMKFGVVSPREVFHIVKDNFGAQHDIIRQLHWRDFYMKIAYFYPFVIGGAMKPEYNKIVWNADPEHVELWKTGETGFPIVDAAMRCLNKIGYMHNRLRMIVSSFFVKDILADWRIGEKYFANKLVDYDISLNNGGWQWSASTGTDSQPYFRIFNPTLQSEKFDKDCEFIFQWIPELKKVEKKHVHDWQKFHSLYKGKIDYPAPMLNHAGQKEKALKMFKTLYEDKSKGNEPEIDFDDEDDQSVEVLPKTNRIKEVKSSGKDGSSNRDRNRSIGVEKNTKNLSSSKSAEAKSKSKGVEKGKKKALDDQYNILESFKLGSKKKK